MATRSPEAADARKYFHSSFRLLVSASCSFLSNSANGFEESMKARRYHNSSGKSIEEIFECVQENSCIADKTRSSIRDGSGAETLALLF
jgi:hypothetical protein